MRSDPGRCVATSLSLRDRVSRLTFAQAAALLGPQGARLIQRGGGFAPEIGPDSFVSDDLLRIQVGDAVFTLTPMAEAPGRLRWNCSRCVVACLHAGAAFSAILENKMALGVAEPPAARVPAERLSEAELVARAIAEREERSRKERLTLRSTQPGKAWVDYLVTNAESGRTYRVALRGLQPGDSYCDCPDFRKNSLGLCKHTLFVQRWVKGRMPAEIRRPHQQKDIAVAVRYDGQPTLRLLLPPKLPAPAARLLEPLRRRTIEDVDDLLVRIRRLEAEDHSVVVYPDAEEFISLRLHQKRIQALVAEIRRNPARHPLRRELLKVELLPYQLDGIAFAVGAGRAILADDMGLGKTIQGIGVAELLAREAAISRVLVVCPASLKSQWQIEVNRFSGRSVQFVLGSAKERPALYTSGSFFTICNYEQVLRDIMAIEKAPWDLIILDEGQRIKNWESRTSRVIKALRSRFALVLSGTPLENNIDELFSVVEFIDDRRLGPAFRFFHRHRVVDEKGRVLAIRNLADLRARLAPVLLRRTRAAVMSELPPRTTEIVRIAPTDEQLALHNNHLQIVQMIVRKPFISEMDLLRLRKALLMCRLTADSTLLVDKQPPGYSSKLERLDELLGGLLAEPERKIILFSEWTAMLDLIEPLIRRRRANFVRLEGSVPQARRQPLVQQFQTDPACRVFISTNAGATGLNLQAADTVVNVDLPWNPAVLEQRIGRAHRMGQKRPVQVYVLVTEQTIEEGLLRTLATKHDLALAALDSASTVDVVEAQSGITELKARLEVLLGIKADAPVDQSERARREAEAERLAQRERVSRAGGELLHAAFAFVEQLLPPADAAASGAVEFIRARLSECVEKSEDGQLRLTVTLPSAEVLDQLAGSLAHVLALQPPR